ncbi:MAG: HAMP domain-containing sensor histidine kinase [Bacteroidales bacterium]
MKLTTIYYRYILYTLFVVLVLGSVTHYYIFRHSIHRSTDDVLEEYRQQVVDYAYKNGTLVSLQELEMQHSRILYSQIEDDARHKYVIYDSLIYSTHQQEKIVYRVMEFEVKANDKVYKVMISQPTLEEDDLITAVFVSLALLFLFFIIASFFVFSYYTHILWRPFYKLLSHLKRYKVEKTEVIIPPHSGIDEFDEINAVVYNMMLQINNDYSSLKELTEDTSHELQTPLSIIKAKLELLQQIELENKKGMELIKSMQSAVNRMSNFNRALLLIAKINNDQFINVEPVNLEELINEFISSCEDILIDRKIEVHYKHKANFVVQMNLMLANRLIMNILSNAIRYNIIGGHLCCVVNEKELYISNTYNHVLPKGDLFGRFIKSSHEKDATGLGLTIVKNICQKSGLKVELRINKTEFGVAILKEDAYHLSN